MNFSLIIIVVMVAAVIPFLTVRWWLIQPKKKTELFEAPVEVSPIKKNQRNPQAILDCLSSDLEANDILGMKKYSIAVVAPEGKMFHGFDVLQALTNAELSFGQGKLFHYYLAKEIIFSVAPQSEPYYFEMENLAEFKTRGLHFILDATKTGYEEFAKEVAVQLADELEGEVCETLR